MSSTAPIDPRAAALFQTCLTCPPADLRVNLDVLADRLEECGDTRAEILRAAGVRRGEMRSSFGQSLPPFWIVMPAHPEYEGNLAISDHAQAVISLRDRLRLYFADYSAATTERCDSCGGWGMADDSLAAVMAELVVRPCPGCAGTGCVMKVLRG